MLDIRHMAVAVMLFSSSAASAADLDLYIPMVPEDPWTGFYIGGHVGWGWGSQDFPAACRCGAAADDIDFDFDGWLGGAQAGYNYQFGDHWLLGAEIDFSWAGMDGEGSTDMPGTFPPGVGTISTSIDWFGTLRGRLGYVNDRWTVYGTAGLAYGSIETAYRSVNVDGSLSGRISDENWGWAVGGGAEFALHERWTVKAEYLFVDLGGGGDQIADEDVHGFYSETDDFSFHTVRLGLNYHF